MDPVQFAVGDLAQLGDALLSLQRQEAAAGAPVATNHRRLELFVLRAEGAVLQAIDTLREQDQRLRQQLAQIEGLQQQLADTDRIAGVVKAATDAKLVEHASLLATLGVELALLKQRQAGDTVLAMQRLDALEYQTRAAIWARFTARCQRLWQRVRKAVWRG